jgi:hypothetical protein
MKACFCCFLFEFNLIYLNSIVLFLFENFNAIKEKLLAARGGEYTYIFKNINN